MVYFIDGNSPGVLYCGTEGDIETLHRHGGSPKRWTRSTPAVGSTIMVLTGSDEEPAIERWSVERPNFAQPWW